MSAIRLAFERARAEAAEHEAAALRASTEAAAVVYLRSEVDQLRAALAAATARAKKAEANLAAVPVEAIRFYHTPYGELSREGSLARRSECRRLIAEWLAQQCEVQP